MNKVKTFFAKISNYIKNSAWIQPILIVVVIFVVLFSLNPLTNAIKSGWTKLTNINNMETISYKEYVEMVKAQADDEDSEDFIVVFSQSNCDICPIFYKSMNAYLKSDEYKSADFKVYNVNLSTKSVKVKIDGTKYQQYKDKTIGLLAPKGETNESILAKDYVEDLDKRIQDFVAAFGGSYTELQAVADSAYTYVATPLVIWYQDGLEVRISNTFEANITKTPDGKQATASSFKNFIQDFEGKTAAADYWAEEFNLTYNTAKSLKD